MRKILLNEKNFLKEMKNGNEDALCYIIEEYGGLVKAVIGKHLYLLVEEQKECFPRNRGVLFRYDGQCAP